MHSATSTFIALVTYTKLTDLFILELLHCLRETYSNLTSNVSLLKSMNIDQMNILDNTRNQRTVLWILQTSRIAGALNKSARRVHLRSREICCGSGLKCRNPEVRVPGHVGSKA